MDFLDLLACGSAAQIHIHTPAGHTSGLSPTRFIFNLWRAPPFPRTRLTCLLVFFFLFCHIVKSSRRWARRQGSSAPTSDSLPPARYDSSSHILPTQPLGRGVGKQRGRKTPGEIQRGKIGRWKRSDLPPLQRVHR